MPDYQQLRTERAEVEAAAARLRGRAIAEAYDGAEAKHVAFSMASILDEIARHCCDVDVTVRAAALQCCAMLTGPTSGEEVESPGR